MSRSLTYRTRIVSVTFGVIGTEDVQKSSCVNVTSYDLFHDNKPVDGGLYNMHMGTDDYSYRCKTCFNKKPACLGHDGHHNMNYPILSPMFVGEIRKWLKLICHECGEPVIREKFYSKFNKIKRLDQAQKIARTGVRRCLNPACGALHPVIKKDPNEDLAIIAEYYTDKRKTDERILYPDDIRQIFERISDATVEKLGKPLSAHPRKFVLRSIKIPTILMRPISDNTASRTQDTRDINTLLQLILKNNMSMPPIVSANIEPKIKKAIFGNCNSYFELIRSSRDGSVKGVSENLKGKRGLFRGHLSGKRVRDIGRSTIVGDVTLKINEVGEPMKFAKNIQMEEYVQEYNKRDLMKYIHNGRKKYPGCTEIIKHGTGTLRTIDADTDIELEPGDILYRDMITGDTANFNRQPSLKPSNISGVVCVVCEDPNILTFRINVISCPLYDADFDGDQMNMIYNSSIQGRNEISILSALSNWFISHSSSSPSVGQVDDSILGLFELTLEGVKFSKYHAMKLFSNTTFTPDFGGLTELTGRDCISMILQETPVSYTGNPTYYDEKLAPYMNYNPADIRVKIDRGKHISGVLDKRTIGKGAENGLYHLIANEYGSDKALDVIFNMQQMAIAYTLQNGFTVGVQDLLVGPKARLEIERVTADIINKSHLITEKLNRGEIIPPIGMTVEEFYEKQQISTLMTADDFIEPVLSALNPRTNNLLKLIMSGSKGQFGNLYNMVSCVGQKLINGERIRQTFGHKRSSPNFRRHETHPESRGNIANSYTNGMTVTEYIPNAMNARFDLIAKALNTSVTGEQNRKSVKNLESIIISNLRFVVKHNSIIQFIYGEDGLDPRSVERVRFPTVMLGDKDLERYRHKTDDPALTDLIDEEMRKLKEDRDEYRKLFMKIELMNTNERMSDVRFMPVNVERVILDTLREYEDVNREKPTPEQLKAMYMRIKEVCNKLPYILLNKKQEDSGAPVPDYMKRAVWLLTMLCRSHLNIAAMSLMTPAILEIIIDKIKIVLLHALIDPGTAAGIIAAQSFSGPLTQYMLDAHHRSAAGGTSKSGMSKAKEVLAARDVDKLDSPSMTLYVLPEYENNHGKVVEIANNIEVMRFKQFITGYQVFFESYGNPIHSKYTHEKTLIDNFAKMNPLMVPPADLLKWCIRIEIDKTALILKNMSMELIITRLRETYPDLYIVYTPENVRNIVIRIYIRSSANTRNIPMKGTVDSEAIIGVAETLLETIIRGVSGILSTSVVKLPISKIGADGAISTNEIYVINTVGTNFRGVLYNKYLDGSKIQTDAIIEIYRHLGIEAARQKLITELRKLSSCNHHHYLVYADEMTRTGRVTSIERSGLGIREASNYLLRIGFSSPIQTLEEASVNAVTDEVTGITAPLLVGSVPRIGTLYNPMQIDPDMITKYVKKPDDILEML